MADKLITKAYPGRLGRVALATFLRNCSPELQRVVNKALTPVVSAMEEANLPAAKNKPKPSAAQIRKLQVEQFFLQLHNELSALERNNAQINLTIKFPAPADVNNEESVHRTIQECRELHRCTTSIDLIGHVSLGALCADLLSLNNPSVWDKYQIDRIEAARHIRFFDLIKAYPILVNLSISFETYLQFASEIDQKARSDINFASRIQRASRNMCIKSAAKTFNSMESEPSERNIQDPGCYIIHDPKPEPQTPPQPPSTPAPDPNQVTSVPATPPTSPMSI